MLVTKREYQQTYCFRPLTAPMHRVRNLPISDESEIHLQSLLTRLTRNGGEYILLTANIQQVYHQLPHATYCTSFRNLFWLPSQDR